MVSFILMSFIPLTLRGTAFTNIQSNFRYDTTRLNSNKRNVLLHFIFSLAAMCSTHIVPCSPSHTIYIVQSHRIFHLDFPELTPSTPHSQQSRPQKSLTIPSYSRHQTCQTLPTILNVTPATKDQSTSNNTKLCRI